jgi:hypothetical protein
LSSCCSENISSVTQEKRHYSRVRYLPKFVLSAAVVLSWPRDLSAQDLRPRAYLITPIHSSAVILGYTFNDGSAFFGTVLPITNASGQYSVPNLSYYHSLSFFKRSANITATLPYVVGTFKGEVEGSGEQIYRSGPADSIFRYSVNLFGGRAMPPKDFLRWKQTTILGASIQVVAPTGQYYSSHLINPGNNRWTFKPELGYSGRWGNWILDAFEEYGCSPRTTTT